MREEDARFANGDATAFDQPITGQMSEANAAQTSSLPDRAKNGESADVKPRIDVFLENPVVLG